MHELSQSICRALLPVTISIIPDNALIAELVILRAVFLEKLTDAELTVRYGLKPYHVKHIRKFCGKVTPRTQKQGLTIGGTTLTAQAWLTLPHHASVTPEIFTKRIQRGWTLNEALTKPKKGKKRYERVKI